MELLLDNAKQNTSVQATLVFAEVAQLGELVILCIIIEVFCNALHPSFYRDVGRSCGTSIGVEFIVRCNKPSKLAISIYGRNILDQQVPLQHSKFYVLNPVVKRDQATIALIAPFCSIALIAQIVMEFEHKVCRETVWECHQQVVDGHRIAKTHILTTICNLYISVIVYDYCSHINQNQAQHYADHSFGVDETIPFSWKQEKSFSSLRSD